MASYSDKQTDKILLALEKKLKKEYRKAWEDLSDKTNDYFEKLEERYMKQYQAYMKGQYTKEQFDAWYKAQIGRGKQWTAMRDQMARRMTSTNEIASAYVNDTTPGIYSLNHNYSLYQIENAYQGTGASFEIIDENTAKRLMEGKNHVEFTVLDKTIGATTYRRLQVNRRKDYNWNTKRITSALNQGILQGENPKKIAKRFMDVMESNHAAAVRNARTAVTSAQNAGRMDSYAKADAMGIELMKEWMSAHDARTRLTHALLDGKRVVYDKPWTTDTGHELMFPADPQGHPSEVYNCRCTMVAVLPAIADDMKRETYEEWYERKTGEKLVKEKQEEDKTKSTYKKYDDLQSKKHSLQNELKDLEKKKQEAELKALSTFDEKDWAKSQKLSDLYDSKEKELSAINSHLVEMQEAYRIETEKYLLGNGICKDVRLSNKMSIDAQISVRNALERQVKDYGLAPVSVYYNPGECKMRGAVAFYENQKDRIYLSDTFKMTNKEYAEHKKLVNESYAMFRKKKNLDEVCKKTILEAEEEYALATDKAHKHFATQKKQFAIINLNTTRKSIPQTLEEVVTHEYGHKLHFDATGNDIYKKTPKFFGNKVLKSKGDRWNENDYSGWVLASELGAYASSSPLEAFAEAYTAYRKGMKMPKELRKLIEDALKKVGAR